MKMMKMGGWSRVVVMVSVWLALMPSLCVGSSDPRAALCEPICWEEEALSDQCVEDRCSSLRHRRGRSRAAYHRCVDRCWDIVAPCRLMCNNKAMDVLEQCDRTCAPIPPAGNNDNADAGMTTTPTTTTTTMEPGCHVDCFTHNMMLIKARVLPPDYLNISQVPSEAARAM